MDTEAPPKTITGSLVLSNSPPKSAPSDDEHKLGTLLRLGSHYWPKDFTPNQAKHFLADYLDDTADFSAAELWSVCRDWRQSIQHKRFPLVAELLVELREQRRSAAAKARYEATRKSAPPDAPRSPPVEQNNRPILWWMKAPYLWNPGWREADIPVEDQAVFRRLLAKNRTAGKQGWGANDFYGLARKHNRDDSAPQPPEQFT